MRVGAGMYRYLEDEMIGEAVGNSVDVEFKMCYRVYL